jgi:23S rRNA (guanine2445-N2)-methyltransferase / 23S rRNA (guanine2069-N7)-methyltransferase
MRDPRDRYLQFFATAAKGAEALLVEELQTIAADAAAHADAAEAAAGPAAATAGTIADSAGVTQERGGVSFDGPLELGYRACLWSRLAQRVLLRLVTLRLDGDPETFWSGLAAIDWSAHLSPDGTLAVDFAGLGAGVGVTNTLFGAQRTKDVVVDQFRERFGRRPSVDLARPDLRINVYVGPREAVVAIDLSGESLHRRGYRASGEQAEAPLKETLAAAVLVRAGWPAIAAGGGSVVDPLCGSGTLPIEAALIAADIAPGLLREAAGPEGPKWGFTGWLGHDADLWQELAAQAGERRKAALARLRSARAAVGGGVVPLAYGYDRDTRAVDLARADLGRAGLHELVRIERRDLAAFSRPADLAALPKPADGATAVPGLVVANPPYGHRLGADGRPAHGAGTGTAERPRAPSERQERRHGDEQSGDGAATPQPVDPALGALYELLGARLRSEFSGWKAAVLVNDLELGKHLDLRARRANHFMNGPLTCTLLRIDINLRAVISKPAAADPATPATPLAVRVGPTTLSPAAEQFANRLRKNARRWSRYMRRAGIGCYRVYDADLPDYSVAVDVYERWVHVQEYAPPPEIDEAKAAGRLAEAMRIIPEVLGATPADVFLKVRARQRGPAQYAQRATTGIEHEVHEREQTFLVNFTDYLDTGLFLPGREVRRLLGELAGGQRFLNLFGYTGTASVAAGRGGAASTTTVDLNGHYLEWAQRNFAVNKLKPERNAVVEADALTWVAQTDQRYGLIYLDPPTFSNSKKMGRATFDVRRDHADLIRLVARRLLEPGGALVFASNARRFTLDAENLGRDHHLEDLSKATLPPDFARSGRSHHVWTVAPRADDRGRG